MALTEHTSQMLFCDVCVALGRGDGGMPEEFLYYPDVYAVSQEECRHGVAQHVRRHVPLYPRLLTEARDDVRDTLSRQAHPRGVQEEGRASRLDLCPSLQVLPLDAHRLLVHHDRQTIPSALPF